MLYGVRDGVGVQRATYNEQRDVGRRVRCTLHAARYWPLLTLSNGASRILSSYSRLELRLLHCIAYPYRC